MGVPRFGRRRKVVSRTIVSLRCIAERDAVSHDERRNNIQGFVVLGIVSVLFGVIVLFGYLKWITPEEILSLIFSLFATLGMFI